MSYLQDNVRHFMELSNQRAPTKVYFLNYPYGLRRSLIDEEAAEFRDASYEAQYADSLDDLETAQLRMIDAVVDLVYVSIGALVAAGVDMDPFWDEVHSANMRKVDGSCGPIVFNALGKVSKPEGWYGPDNLRILRKLKDGP